MGTVSRVERSEPGTRSDVARIPDCASLHPGYEAPSLMVRRRVSAVSNHEARGPSFETPLRGSSSNNGEAVMQG
jgi:hypothetical protein